MDRGYTSPIQKLEDSDFSNLVDLALQEDLPQGDITTDSLFSKEDTCQARLYSKDTGVLCGTQVVHSLIQKTNANLVWSQTLPEGSRLEPNQVIGTFSGSLADLLKIERILLNFIQYLSGIATNAWQVSSKYPNLLILDTRKTLPGYRKLAKYAVYIGGGANHRINLSDMAMLKDNHIAKAGDIYKAVALVRSKNPNKKIELEIDSLEQLKDAVTSKPDIILLDNFSNVDTEKAVEYIRSEGAGIRIECSGGITPDKLEYLSQFKDIGVSMGYLTHTVRFLDISLDIL